MSPPALPGRVAAIVPAAGRGERLGPGLPKALRPLGGRPLLVHAVQALAAARLVELVVVAAPPDVVAEIGELPEFVGLEADLLVVAGGATRQESVAAALAVLPADVDVVLVHDAARPLAPPDLADAVALAVRQGHPAVVPGVAVVDTVKTVDERGAVVSTPDRSTLRAVQTPQGFQREVLVRAHGSGQTAVTDDAGLVERLGIPVQVVPGSEEAFKVTRPLDLALAEVVLARRGPGGSG